MKAQEDILDSVFVSCVLCISPAFSQFFFFQVEIRPRPDVVVALVIHLEVM